MKTPSLRRPCAWALFLSILAEVALLAPSTASADIAYEFVTVGNPGNANDSTGYGGVTYNYAIGKFLVTVAQYTEFLNAVAQKSDPTLLYNPKMASEPNSAGISRSGDKGNYSYSVIGDERNPVCYVTWFSAARFCNWLHNGQKTGLGEVDATTEAGAYGDLWMNRYAGRKAGAKYWLPTENEWYKAAYYDPSLNGGRGGYWKFATKSNSEPGNNPGGDPNQANYLAGGRYSVTQSAQTYNQNCLTNVGAFYNCRSAYGTFDQSGLLFEWMETMLSVPIDANGRTEAQRVRRGGSWSNNAALMRSDYRASSLPEWEGTNTGIRIAKRAD